MLTKGDDYPLHQTPDPIAYVGANRNFYDRFFFNGYDPSGEIFFAAAMGVYPYVNVMDAAFSVVLDGVQHNVYGSKTMHMERLNTEVGAVKVEIIEPLETVRLSCNDPENGIKAELLFSHKTAAHEEPRFMRRSGSQVTMDVTRMTQNGVWQGYIEVKGRRVEVTPETFRGTRDRSWGIRAIGEADPQANPYAPAPQFYWVWAPMNFDGFAAHYFVNDDEYGRAWNSNGIFIPFVDDAPEIANTITTDWRSEMSFESGRRHAKSATVWYHDEAGGEYRFDFTPKWNFYMHGIGYGHDVFKHGRYHGELKQGYDEFVVADVPAERLHIQAMCDIKLTTPNGEHHGQGVLEQLIIGPHEPSGFKDMMDTLP